MRRRKMAELFRFLTRHSVQLTKIIQLVRDLPLESSRGGLVPARLAYTFRQVGFASGVGFGLIVRVSVQLAVAKLLHEFGRCIA